MGSSKSKVQAATGPPQHVDIPQTCYLYYSKAKLSLQFNICDEDSKPVCLVTVPAGWAGDMFIHGGLSKTDAPLSKAELARGVHTKITIYPTNASLQPITEEMRFHRNGWLGAQIFTISIKEGELPERFEWRGSKGDDVKSLGETSTGHKLVRLGKDDEVVAVWAPAKLSLNMYKAAKFKFLNSGATGELSDDWAKMAITTFVRMYQNEMQAATTAAV